jgi:DNA-binding transcriptional LysR family regulator
VPGNECHQDDCVVRKLNLFACWLGSIALLLPEQVVSAPLKEGLIERVLSEWTGAKNILHLVYPSPRGMLPSVRSFIDYLMIHVPAWLEERNI